jgi:hypothetical protein
MHIQNIEFSRLKSFLSRIEISDQLICIGDNEDYDEVLRTKKHNEDSLWIVTFNRESSVSFFNSLEKHHDKFFKEISINILIKDNKIMLHNYLKEAYEFFTEITNEIYYDITLKKWICGFAHLNDKFMLNKLDGYFNHQIQNFFEDLNTKINTMVIHLNEIEEYNECVKNIETSSHGNSKIIWTKNSNQLVYFFLKMIEKGIIDTSHENLKKFIFNNFLDKNRIELNEYTLDTYFKPSAGKHPKRGQVDPGDFIKPD